MPLPDELLELLEDELVDEPAPLVLEPPVALSEEPPPQAEIDIANAIVRKYRRVPRIRRLPKKQFIY